tara:strand:+ start:5636 stop:5806 length:171 start_codon:yes stop_codon:yes gene_type:complete
MLDIKNIPVYTESKKKRVSLSSSKKPSPNKKHMDEYYDKTFLDNYFNNLYEGNAKK